MYEIIVDHEPNQTDNDIISEGLFASYKSIIGQRDKSFSVFLKKDSGEIFGGLQAFLDTQSVYIDLMWIEESFRNKGFGKKLLQAAEKEAIKHGCIFSTVDTWDFQAPKFYLKNGYERIGEIRNYWFDQSYSQMLCMALKKSSGGDLLLQVF